MADKDKDDDRTYIKVHDGMVDHPKIVELSDKSFRLLITLWSYSSRHLTDGHVPRKVARSLGTRATRELTDAGLLVEGDNGYECRHYLRHQRSRARVEEIKEIRSVAGKKGGRPKATSKQDETNLVSKTQSQNNPETETETETETEITPVVPLSDDAPTDDQAQKNGRKRPAHPLPDDWKPTDKHLQYVKDNGLDGPRELAKFKAHAEANDRRQVSWNGAFTQWLLNARPSSASTEPDIPHYFRRSSGGESA